MRWQNLRLVFGLFPPRPSAQQVEPAHQRILWLHPSGTPSLAIPSRAYQYTVPVHSTALSTSPRRPPHTCMCSPYRQPSHSHGRAASSAQPLQLAAQPWLHSSAEQAAGNETLSLTLRTAPCTCHEAHEPLQEDDTICTAHHVAVQGQVPPGINPMPAAHLLLLLPPPSRVSTSHRPPQAHSVSMLATPPGWPILSCPLTAVHPTPLLHVPTNTGGEHVQITWDCAEGALRLLASCTCVGCAGRCCC